jgi:DNA repair protein RadD
MKTYNRAHLRPLRDYQAVTVEKVQEALKEGVKRIMVQGPCGFGKTLTAAHLMADYVEAGKRVCFVAPRLTLIDQSVDAFGAEGYYEHIGVIQGQHPMTNYRRLLQVASLQTLTRRELPKIDMFIVDEAHMTSDAFLKLVASNPDTPFIGLSATPWRAGLGLAYEKLIVAETTQGLIDRGFLTPSRTFAPVKAPDLTGVRVLGTGEYNQGQLAAAVNKREIVGDIIKHWLSLGENRQTICFCVDRAHAKHVQERFEEAGVPTAYVDCFTDAMDRRDIVKGFRNGDIRIICNVGVLTTGFDAPEASCMIDAAPTKSMILHVQKTGRVLRTAQGKTDALILDHAGNTVALGLVNEIRREWMCDGSEESKAKRQANDEPKPRTCPECKTVVPKIHLECPHCGHKFYATTQVVHRDEALVEMGKREARREEQRIIADSKREFFGELKYICQQRGYKDGWAAVKYRERFGVWPNDPEVRHAPMKAPSLATANWIRSKAIAYAKQMGRG